jgi:anti-sigma factor RsiW
MLTKHVTSSLEAYLDNQLPAAERRSVEVHLANCPACTKRLYAIRRLVDELRPTMLAALGQPAPPSALRQRIRQTLKTRAESPRPFFDWAVPGRVLNTVGTLAVMALLAFGVWAVIQGQIPGAEILLEESSLSPGNDGAGEQTTAATPTVAPLLSVTSQPPSTNSSIGDTLPKPIKVPGAGSTDGNDLEAPSIPAVPGTEGRAPETSPQKPDQPDKLELPGGTIAFAYFNQASNRQVYETHLISANGRNHRLFPLDGVSEPALNPRTSEYQLAFRAYSEPTSPRSLLSGDLEAKKSFE